MDNEMSLVMRIRSLFDGTGSKEAAANVAAIGKASEDMSVKSKSAAGSTEKAFSAINSAAAVTEGGVMGVGNAVKNLAGQFPALNAALGPVGLALAAFAAWKKAIDAVRESRESLARGRFDTTVGNEEASIRSLARAYDELQRSISSAEDARKRLSDAESAKDDARLAADLAKLELAQAEAQAALDPGDSFGRRRVDLDFAARRSSITDAAALRRSDRELSGLRGEGATQEAFKRAAEETVAALTEKFSTLSKEYAAVNAKAQSADKWWAVTDVAERRVKEAAYKQAQPDLARIAAAMEAVAAKLTAATDTRDAAERTLFTLGEKAEVNRMSRDTLLTRQQTGSVNSTASRYELSRDVQAEQARFQAETARQSAAAAEAGLSRAQANRNILSAEKDLRTSRNSGDSAAVAAAVEKLAAAQAERDRVITSKIDKLAEQTNRTAEAVKNLPNN